MNKNSTDDISIGNKIIKILKSIYDPELPVDIYELGLIYDVLINDQMETKIIMTLTSPNCPVAEILPKEVEEKVSALEEIKSARVELTFEPKWTKEMMSEEAKLVMGFL